MNKTLAFAFIGAVTNPNFIAVPSWCEKLFRQVDESVDGNDYEAYFKSSARLTALAFLSDREALAKRGVLVFTGGEIEAHGGLQAGDVLFKVHGSGDFGHVGDFVDVVPGIGSKLVAENSSTHIGRVQGAKGYRTLDQWGHIDVVVRFPDPRATMPAGPRLILAVDHPSGYIYTALKSAQHDATAGTYTVEGSELARILGEPAGKVSPGRGSLRTFLNILGYAIEKTGDHLDDANDPRFYVFVEKAKH